MRILSTKKLKQNQRELLLNAGASFVDYDALNIKYLAFDYPTNISNAIFTSKNAAKAVFSQHSNSKQLFQYCFCVGEKTKAFLNKKGQKVTEIAQNATELGKILVKNYQNEQFLYFCGTNRRDELPNLLKLAEIDYFEVKTYRSTPNCIKFDQKWDGILFFSPLGVQSYLTKNSINESLAVGIGETTISEIKKHTTNYVVANSTTTESMIAKAIKTLQHVSN